MKKIKEMLHHGHNESDTTVSSDANAQTYSTSRTTSTVPEREIIGDKIDRAGTWEQGLPKHSHLPADSATVSSTNYSSNLPSSLSGKESTHHIPSSSTTTTTSSSFTPIGTTSASHHSTFSKELPKSSMATQSAPVVQPALVTPVTTTSSNAIPLASTTKAATIVSAPVQMERVEKPVVIQERVLPIQKEEIQPIIHREREQLDVKQITQQLHETKIQPTLVQQRALAAEVKPVSVMPSAPIAPNLVQPTMVVEPARQSTVVHTPIVEETVKKTIIEEVQPVIQRDVVAPTVIQEVKPIYEKVVEAPRVFKETLATRELGVNGATREFQQGFGLAQPQQASSGSWNNNQQQFGNSGLNNQQFGNSGLNNQQFSNSGLNNQQQFNTASGLNSQQQQFNNSGLLNKSADDFNRQKEYKEELNTGMLGEHSSFHNKGLNEQEKLKTFDNNKNKDSEFINNKNSYSSGTQYPTSH